MTKLVIAFLLTLPVLAQDATVYHLTHEQQAKAKILYQAHRDADKAWTQFTLEMTKELGEPVEFTKEFEFAVPRQSATIAISNRGCQFTTTPTSLPAQLGYSPWFIVEER